MDDFTPCMSFLNSGMLGVAPVSLGALGGAGACFWPVCMSLVQYRPRGTRGMRLRSFLPPVTQLDYTAVTCLILMLTDDDHGAVKKLVCAGHKLQRRPEQRT